MVSWGINNISRVNRITERRKYKMGSMLASAGKL